MRWSFAGSKYQRSTGEKRKAAVKERDKLEIIAQWWFENKDNLDAPELLKSSFDADIETFIRMKNANCKQISQKKSRTMLKHFKSCTGFDSVVPSPGIRFFAGPTAMGGYFFYSFILVFSLVHFKIFHFPAFVGPVYVT